LTHADVPLDRLAGKVVAMRRARSQPEKDKEPQGAATPTMATSQGQAGPLAELQANAGNEVVNRLVDAHSETNVEVGAAGGEVTAATEAAITTSAGSGSPLPSGVRRAMEGAFGADFGAIRIHAGADASELNERLQSQAFTAGTDIFFRDGEPDMTSSSGQQLLAHELTHTIQQGAAGVASTGQPAIGRRHSVADLLRGAQPKLAVGSASDSAEQEADQVARQVVQALRSPAPQPPVRQNRGPDPLAAELERASIQRNGVALGPVGLQGEQKAPAFTAETRTGGAVLTDAMKQTLTDAVLLARTWAPKALGAAGAINPDADADRQNVDTYFKLAKDPEFVRRAEAFRGSKALWEEAKKTHDAAAPGPAKDKAHDAWMKAYEDLEVKKGERVAHLKKLTTDTKTKLQDVLGKVQAGLAKDQIIKDMNPDPGRTDPDEKGYVHPRSRGWFNRPGDIHLRFSMLATETAEKVGTIFVHEATHKYANTDDNAYKHEVGKWGKMTHAQALKNADSYSEYVKDFGQ
jgi:Domain of unknown function (DUF4157)/Lysine-specific metallo-endopeptidase